MPEGGKIIIRTANHVEASAVDQRAALMPAGRYVALTISDPARAGLRRFHRRSLTMHSPGREVKFIWPC